MRKHEAAWVPFGLIVLMLRGPLCLQAEGNCMKKIWLDLTSHVDVAGGGARARVRVFVCVCVHLVASDRATTKTCGAHGLAPGSRIKHDLLGHAAHARKHINTPKTYSCARQPQSSPIAKQLSILCRLQQRP